MEAMGENARRGYIDTARGIGILLVVFSHTMIPAIRNSFPVLMKIWVVIYAFHMPLFFLVAGYCYELSERRKRHDILPYLGGRARALLLPYLTMSVCAYLIIGIAAKIPGLGGFLAANGYTGRPFFQAAGEILSVLKNMDLHLWFMPRMFAVSAVACLLRGYTKKWWVLAICFLYLALPVSFGAVLDRMRPVILYGMFFFIGQLLPDWERVFQGRQWTRALCCGGALLGFALLERCAHERIESPYLLSLFFTTTYYGMGISGSMMVLHGAKGLENCRILSYLGERAFPIYLFHQPFIVSGISGILFSVLGLSPWITIPGAFACGIGIPLLANEWIIKRSRVLQLLFLGERWKKEDAA